MFGLLECSPDVNNQHHTENGHRRTETSIAAQRHTNQFEDFILKT